MLLWGIMKSSALRYHLMAGHMKYHITLDRKDIAKQLSQQLHGAISEQVLCGLDAARGEPQTQAPYYEARALMLDHCILTLDGAAAALACQLRALDLLQQERLLTQEADAAQLIQEAAVLTILHTMPALITPAQLAHLDPIERDAALGLRDMRVALHTLCERLDLPPARLRRAHTCAIRKLSAAI
jgi:hypothetical protein